MSKFLRVAGLSLILAATLVSTSKPVMACLSNCDTCHTWGCKATAGCWTCCAQGTKGCIMIP